MRPLRLALVLIALAALGTATLWFIAAPPATLRNVPPPWEVAVDGYHWRPLGWQLGKTTPEEVAKRLGSDLQWAIVRRPGQPFVLEAWLPDFATQGITGKLLLQFQLLEPLQALAASLESGTVRVTATGSLHRSFDPLRADPAWRDRPRLIQVAFLPTARLDEATLLARFAHFGAAKRWVDEAGDVHLLYTLSCPSPCEPLGIHLLVPAQKGSVLIEYAPLERLQPLVPP